MKSMDLVQLLLYIIVLIGLAIPLGHYMSKVFKGEKTWLDPVVNPVEKMVYRLAGVNAGEEMNWIEYTVALLIFNLLGIIFLFILQLLQGLLPLNPAHLQNIKPDLAFNTAVSFVTNTNWQTYSPETTVSYLTQMLGLAVQNFVSAATGIAVVVALIRGLTRHSSKSIGNFWTDLTRSILKILLPMSLVLALLLISQGVIQNFDSYHTVTTLEGAKQTLAMGPIASQEAIKEIGTNGGGPLNANSSHPFENPTPLSNWLEMLAILIIPVGLTFTFGDMVGDKRQGRAIFAGMLILLVLAVGICYGSEAAGNPQVAALGVQSPTAMEGKEVRFGIANSSLFAAVTTATSCGAVNAMHDSFTPIGGMMPMLQIMLGEVVFGGVGSGLYAMLLFAILAVFIIGLMVGRTPEYLGKKIEPWEMKMVTIGVLVPAALILIGSAITAVSPAAVSSATNPGPHGLSEILYAFSSAAGNNGSAFAGLNANTFFYNLVLAVTMFIGRFGVIVPVMAVSGSLAAKQTVPVGLGTFQTNRPLFTILLLVTVLIVGALTFFPALALGPLVEHLLMFSGKAF